MRCTRSRYLIRLVASIAPAWLLVAVIGMSSGCGVALEGEGPGHRQQYLALRPEQELALGREAYQEILSQARVVHSGGEVERVSSISRKIAEAVKIEPLQREINLHVAHYPFEWEYAVIESRQINAFCLPGGKIGVLTGLLEVVENDDQLAAVIAHEVAHALAHHASERIAREQLGGRGLLRLSYDREQELEADHIGAFLMTFAGYDPRQAVRLWERMESIHGRGAELPEILSDHPSNQRRIEELGGWAKMALAAKEAYESGRIAPAGSAR